MNNYDNIIQKLLDAKTSCITIPEGDYFISKPIKIVNNNSVVIVN